MTSLEGIFRKWSLELVLFLLSLTLWGAALAQFLNTFTPAHVLTGMFLTFIIVKNKLWAGIRRKGEIIPIRELEIPIRHNLAYFPPERPAGIVISKFHNEIEFKNSRGEPEVYAYFCECEEDAYYLVVLADALDGRIRGKIEYMSSTLMNDISFRNWVMPYVEQIKRHPTTNIEEFRKLEKKIGMIQGKVFGASEEIDEAEPRVPR